MTTFQEIRELMRNSAPDDWYTIQEGPTYRSRFAYSTGPDNQWRLEEDSHHTTLVYRPDVDLTIAHGMDVDSPISDPELAWAKAFSDKSVQLQFADILWRGSLIDRVDYARVDGARGIVPMGGGHDGLNVTSYERDVARLLHDVRAGNFGTFGNFFNKVPFRVTED